MVWSFKKLLSYFQRPQICLVETFGQIEKVLNLEPKMFYLLCFGQQFGKNIVMFEVSGLRFFLLQSLIKKQKSLNLGPNIFSQTFFFRFLRAVGFYLDVSLGKLY